VSLFTDTATTEIYALPLHDALPILSSTRMASGAAPSSCCRTPTSGSRTSRDRKSTRLNSQSHLNLVCRLLLEKKRKKNHKQQPPEQKLDRLSTCTRNTTHVLPRHSFVILLLLVLALVFFFFFFFFFKETGPPQIPPFSPPPPFSH